jgi:hypothetical protein
MRPGRVSIEFDRLEMRRAELAPRGGHLEGEMCLPTALSCRLRETETSVYRRFFGSSKGMRERYTVLGLMPIVSNARGVSGTGLFRVVATGSG